MTGERFGLHDEIDVGAMESEMGSVDVWGALNDTKNGGDVFFVSTTGHDIHTASAHDGALYLAVAHFDEQELAEKVAEALADAGFETASVMDTFNRYEKPWTLTVEVEDA